MANSSKFRSLLLVACTLLLVVAVQRVESAKCAVGGTKCDKATPDICTKCKKGYELTSSGACNCAEGYGSTVDGSVPDPPKSFPTFCEWPAPPGEKKPKNECKCRKCKTSKNPDKNMYGAGGPVTIAKCTAPPGNNTVALPTAPARMPASYQIGVSPYTGQYRWWVRAQFGTPPQPVNLIFDSGSFAVHTCGFNAAASSTAVSQNYSTVLYYGSGPVNITDFYADVVSLPGFSTASGGAAYTLTNPSWRWIGSTGYNASCVPTSTVSYGGLVGAGPGGMQGLAAGANCSAPQGGQQPCATEVPPMIQALLSANNLPPMYTIDLPPPSPTSPADNVNLGTVYLGGAPPNLPATATLVSTPLQPNRWRNDVANGTNSYAWWQFNPLSMDIEYFDGSTVNICDSTAVGGLAAPRACTVIADTGYSWVPVQNATALAALVDATKPKSKTCARQLLVKLPTNLEGTTSASIAIPLSSKKSACGDVINQNTFGVQSTDTVFDTPGKSVEQYLTPNWFTFGQPILQLFQITFDTTAFNGNGGLHFIVNANGNPVR